MSSEKVMLDQVSMQPYAQGECDGKTKTSLVSRNITVSKRRTSIRLEPEMWSALKDIARREQCTVHDICSLVSLRKKENSSLTAAIRVFIMLYYRAAATDDGHRRAGHGSFDQMRARARISAEMLQMFFGKSLKNMNSAYF